MTTTNQSKTSLLADIIEIRELSYPNDVNKHIKLGWKLLDAYQSSSTSKQTSFRYCIGWPKSAGNLKTVKTAAINPTAIEKKKYIYSL